MIRTPPADLAAWIIQARSGNAPAIATFASGLDADLAAVRAALTEPRPDQSAQAHQVPMLRMGRPRSLERRMVLAARSTQNDRDHRSGAFPLTGDTFIAADAYLSYLVQQGQAESLEPTYRTDLHSDSLAHRGTWYRRVRARPAVHRARAAEGLE